MEQLVAGTTYFLRYLLALHSVHGAACCWKDMLSPASVGTTFPTWSGLLLEGPDFSSNHWHNILYMVQLVAGATYFLRHVLALFSLHGAACRWNCPTISAGVGTIFLTWSSLWLELPDFFSKRWYYILYMEQLIAGRTYFP